SLEDIEHEVEELLR
nr:RecName: Full=Lipovitellin-1; Short=SmLV1 [Schizocosa malitiosa]